MRAILIASGKLPSKKLFSARAEEADCLVAVDGGLEVFRDTDRVPDLIVGDMDSVDGGLLSHYLDRSEIIKAPVEKDETDTALAIDAAVSRGADDILLLGATGGRIDHLLSNLMLFQYSRKRKADLIIEDDEQLIVMRKGRFVAAGYPGQTISIIPVNARAKVSAKGLYYPLDQLVLTNQKPRGVSNVMLGDCAEIISDDDIFIISIKKQGR